MNIQQAIKSGKKFRRKGWSNPGWLNTKSQGVIHLVLAVGDLVADDWEVEQVAVTITSQQFWDAFKSSAATSYQGLARQMAKQLGLEVE